METTQIQGMDPADYAALWGDQTADGALFYNVSSENQVKDWVFWNALFWATVRKIGRVAQYPDLHDPEDRRDLATLLCWVIDQGNACPPM